MPYVQSEKTNPPAYDRKILDAAVEVLAKQAAGEITNNLSLITVFREIFFAVAETLVYWLRGGTIISVSSSEGALARAIYEVSMRYGYEGAYLGEFNYAITRFIQRVPQIMIADGKWEKKDEFRYWVYAATASALRYAENHTEDLNIGVDGVFRDILDEYKWRVNRPYETAQIVKSGDCYDTPFYNKPIEVAYEDGVVIGHVYLDLKRSKETLNLDILNGQIVVRKKLAS